MDWSKGFTARYTLSVIDPDTWRDIDTMQLVSGSITRGSNDLMQSADIELKQNPGERWIRIYLDARQEGEAPMRVPLFAGLTSAPKRELNGNRETFNVSCYSVLKPASDILLQRGWYAPAGMDGAQLAKMLLDTGHAPIEIEGDAPSLTTAIVAEDSETNLSMALKILTAIGWRIRLAGDGTIQIQPNSMEEVAIFDAIQSDMLELSAGDEQDWFSCPNVFRAVADDMVAIARDDSEESVLSTVNRGREIWAEDTDCTLNSGESLADYAARRLKEEQAPARKVSYSRRFMPNVTIGDLVRIHYPANDIDGAFLVTSQKLTLGHGCRTDEESTYERI